MVNKFWDKFCPYLCYKIQSLQINNISPCIKKTFFQGIGIKCCTYILNFTLIYKWKGEKWWRDVMYRNRNIEMWGGGGLSCTAI